MKIEILILIKKLKNEIVIQVRVGEWSSHTCSIALPCGSHSIMSGQVVQPVRWHRIN